MGVIGIRKKLFIVILILSFIGIGIFFLTKESNINETKDKPITQKTELEEDTEQEEMGSEQEEIEEEPPVTEQVKDFITDAVKNTIDFFLNKEMQVVAIGDSLTQGVGDNTGNGGYVGILDKTINKSKKVVEFENFGKRGNRSEQLLKRLDEPEISKAIKGADIVLITIGANDIMQVAKENFSDLTLESFIEKRQEYEENLEDIFIKIDKINPETPIYLLGFYNPFGKYFKDIKELDIIVDGWNNAGKTITEEHEDITFIPVKDLFEDDDIKLFANDNFHPNYLGYQRIANRVLEYVTKQEGELHDENSTTN